MVVKRQSTAEGAIFHWLSLPSLALGNRIRLQNLSTNPKVMIRKREKQQFEMLAIVPSAITLSTDGRLVWLLHLRRQMRVDVDRLKRLLREVLSPCCLIFQQLPWHLIGQPPQQSHLLGLRVQMQSRKCYFAL